MQIIFMFLVYLTFHFLIEVSLLILDSNDFIFLWSSNVYGLLLGIATY